MAEENRPYVTADGLTIPAALEVASGTLHTAGTLSGTKAEWAVQSEALGGYVTRHCPSREHAEREAATMRLNYPWPEEIRVVSRQVTEWREVTE